MLLFSLHTNDLTLPQCNAPQVILHSQKKPAARDERSANVRVLECATYLALPVTEVNDWPLYFVQSNSLLVAVFSAALERAILIVVQEEWEGWRRKGGREGNPL